MRKTTDIHLNLGGGKGRGNSFLISYFELSQGANTRVKSGSNSELKLYQSNQSLNSQSKGFRCK